MDGSTACTHLTRSSRKKKEIERKLTTVCSKNKKDKGEGYRNERNKRRPSVELNACLQVMGLLPWMGRRMRFSYTRCVGRDVHSTVKKKPF